MWRILSFSLVLSFMCRATVCTRQHSLFAMFPFCHVSYTIQAQITLDIQNTIGSVCFGLIWSPFSAQRSTLLKHYLLSEYLNRIVCPTVIASARNWKFKHRVIRWKWKPNRSSTSDVMYITKQIANYDYEQISFKTRISCQPNVLWPIYIK